MTTKKRARKQDDEQFEVEDQVGRAEQRDTDDGSLKLDDVERESAVCWLFTRGYPVPEIIIEMKKRYGKAGEMSREKPYRILQRAAARGRLMYTPPSHLVLAQKVFDAYSWLKRVHVVHTTVSVDVAREAASMLLGMVKERRRSFPKRDEVHIGFAAGMSMRQVAQAFAELLRYPTPNLPKKIVFHAMVTGHDYGNPTTDPNAFFTFFLYPPVLEVEPGFVGLHAPAMVRSRDIPKLKSSLEINDAYKAAKQLDIIATSGSDWDDAHSSLRVCMERSPDSVKRLRDLGTIGDVFWRPLGKDGPITYATEIRALTLMELTDLPGFIQKGGNVLLMLGPCGMCKRSKGKIVHTILTQKLQLVTHLVLDSRTAVHLLEITGPQNNGIPAHSWAPGKSVGERTPRK